MKAGAVSYLASLLKPDRSAKMTTVLGNRTNNLALVLENIGDPHNSAACLRSAEAFGIQNIHVIERYAKFSPNIEITKGADRWLSIHRYRNTRECVDHLHSNNYKIFASELSTTSKPIEEINFPPNIGGNPANKYGRVALVFGSEGRGVR